MTWKGLNSKNPVVFGISDMFFQEDWTVQGKVNSQFQFASSDVTLADFLMLSEERRALPSQIVRVVCLQLLLFSFHFFL